jgi:hypothetical protein
VQWGTAPNRRSAPVVISALLVRRSYLIERMVLPSTLDTSISSLFIQFNQRLQTRLNTEFGREFHLAGMIIPNPAAYLMRNGTECQKIS